VQLGQYVPLPCREEPIRVGADLLHVDSVGVDALSDHYSPASENSFADSEKIVLRSRETDYDRW